MSNRSRLGAVITLALLCFVVLAGAYAAFSPPGGGRTRTYYIAADEVVWDYAPAGRNAIAGRAFEGLEHTWVTSAGDRIGHLYRKSIYREYTDDAFTTLKPRAPEWEHLGILGPLLRGAVGDTIVVVFKNNTRFPASMHPHGVFYTKASEGAGSADATSAADRLDDAVPPHGTFTYVWPIPERAGPAAGDGSSILWMYHSHVDEILDVNAGLMGPIIVTAPGMAREDGSPKDVDQELVVAFDEVDENMSWYLEENIQAYAGDPDSIDRSHIFFWFPFGLSNLKETMNGFLYGNLELPALRVGERVRWYLMSSTNFEIHAPHWHGNTVVANHMRADMANLGSMGMIVADMVPDNPGTWLFHCHVAPHLAGGMQAQYTVEPAGELHAG